MKMPTRIAVMKVNICPFFLPFFHCFYLWSSLHAESINIQSKLMRTTYQRRIVSNRRFKCLTMKFFVKWWFKEILHVFPVLKTKRGDEKCKERFSNEKKRFWIASRNICYNDSTQSQLFRQIARLVFCHCYHMIIWTNILETIPNVLHILNPLKYHWINICNLTKPVNHYSQL